MATEDGTRFELTLEASEGAQRAIYRAVVHTPGQEHSATVEITPSGARITEAGEGLDPGLAKQLEAIARTLGKRADEGPWPRRINRWRQPGVR